jgi:hypothetical protein
MPVIGSHCSDDDYYYLEIHAVYLPRNTMPPFPGPESNSMTSDSRRQYSL